MNYNFLSSDTPKPIKDVNEEFPHGFDDPHFSDNRFEGSKPLSTFLAEGYELTSKNCSDVVDDEDIIYFYFDRLLTSAQGDSSGAIEAAKRVEGGRKKPLFYQEYLKAYFGDDELELVHVLAGVQVAGNGMPYWALGFKSPVLSEEMKEDPSDSLKTPEDWIEELCPNVSIIDADGWRGEDAPAFDEPISREEFRQRLLRCTADKIPEALYTPQD